VAHLKQGVAVGAVVSTRAGAALQQRAQGQSPALRMLPHTQLHNTPVNSSINQTHLLCGLARDCQVVVDTRVPAPCLLTAAAEEDGELKAAVGETSHRKAGFRCVCLSHPFNQKRASQLISGPDQLATLAARTQAATLSITHLG
jgi:hypothetical protein